MNEPVCLTENRDGKGGSGADGEGVVRVRAETVPRGARGWINGERREGGDRRLRAADIR